jgi:hypothetical protein
LQCLAAQVKFLPQDQMAQSLDRIIDANSRALIESDGVWHDNQSLVRTAAVSNIEHLPVADRKRGFDAILNCDVQPGLPTVFALIEVTDVIDKLRSGEQLEAFLSVLHAARSLYGPYREGLFHHLETQASLWEHDVWRQAWEMVPQARAALR